MNAAEHPGGLLLRHFRHADGNEDPNVRNGPNPATMNGGVLATGIGRQLRAPCSALRLLYPIDLDRARHAGRHAPDSDRLERRNEGFTRATIRCIDSR